MKINKTIIIVIVLLGLLVGSWGAGVFLGQWALSANAAPAAQEDDDADEAGDVEDNDTDEANEADDASDNADDTGDVEDNDADEPNEADEDDASPDQAGITPDEAKAAAEAANPGAKALDVDLENENGTILYEVELDNGLEVQVDANNSNILGADQEDTD
jgi:uncharacterized membrane protein YkoI